MTAPAFFRDGVAARPRTTTDQLDALDALNDAAVRTPPPCRTDPGWWTTDPPGGSPKAKRQWFEERKALCASCPVLAQCTELVTTGYRVDGVTAGRYYDDGKPVDRTPNRTALRDQTMAQTIEAGERITRAHRLRANGMTPADIARALNVTPRTVQRYLTVQAAS